MEMDGFGFQLYLVLDHGIPGLAAQCIADDELEDVKREVGDNAEDPDDSTPAPSNTLDSSKAPVCIDSNYGSQLNAGS